MKCSKCMGKHHFPDEELEELFEYEVCFICAREIEAQIDTWIYEEEDS